MDDTLVRGPALAVPSDQRRQHLWMAPIDHPVRLRRRWRDERSRSECNKGVPTSTKSEAVQSDSANCRSHVCARGVPHIHQ